VRDLPSIDLVLDDRSSTGYEHPCSCHLDVWASTSLCWLLLLNTFAQLYVRGANILAFRSAL
jgi:hypothetical protein